MPLKNAIGATSALAARHLGLRRRYFYTKNNTLRLRYVASLTAVCAAVLPTMVAFSPLTGIKDHLVLSSTAQAYNAIDTSVGVESADVADSGTDSMELANVPQFDAPLMPSDRVVTIGKGQALGKVIQNEGVSGDDAHAIISAMKDHFDPRGIRAGQDVQMHFEPKEGGEQGYKLTNLKIELNPLKTLTVSKNGDDYESALHEKEVKRFVQAKKAVIKNSLYGSAAKAGIPKTIVSDAIKVYSQNIDFQRDVHSGDSIELMYETHETEDGFVAKTGNLLFAQLTIGGRKMPLYRYEATDGSVGYYGPDGKSTKKTLMKTPVDGARISSGYGMRRHPVLGYSKMHKGIDFAAPTGTPIYAAGDGRIVKAGRFSSYGNYIRISHRGDLDTAYGHLSRIAKGIKPGTRVRQGQLIGYVGTTGRSTGPHLHYEIMVGNRQVNPLGLNLPVGHALAGRDLKRFKAFVNDVHEQYAQRFEGVVRVAQRSVETKDKED